MLVLGIDPGTATTGYGLVDEKDGSLQLIECGVIRTSSREAMAVRLNQIYHAVRNLIDQHRPTALSVEELFFSSNARTAFAVGQARGVCVLAGAEAGLTVYEYTPLEVKQAVVGYGRASKQQVQQMVCMLLGIVEVPQPDDAADAVAVAICHLHSFPMAQMLQNSEVTGCSDSE